MLLDYCTLCYSLSVRDTLSYTMQTTTSNALRALARELAPLIAEELGLEPRPRDERPRARRGRYDHATIVEFLSPLHLGDSVLLRARTFFGRLAEAGQVGSLELVELLDLKGPTSIPANLTNPLKKRAARLALDLPWEEDADRENRTIWRDRDGIAERMVAAIDVEIDRRGLSKTALKHRPRPLGQQVVSSRARSADLPR
jgi:hypothetical protein